MTVSASIIAAAITDAPAWALIGLTMHDEQMRERGAEELARWIVERIDHSSDAEQASSVCRSDLRPGQGD